MSELARNPYKLFYCYAHEDKTLRDTLDSHLSALKRQKRIEIWYDGKIGAGTEWENEINKHLSSADIVLLLVSAAFLASDYCYSKEMEHALQQHAEGTARVVPIIFRPVYWKNTPFSNLQALPTGAIPVTSWRNTDEAYENITRNLDEVIEKLQISRETANKKVLPFLNPLQAPPSPQIMMQQGERPANANLPLRMSQVQQPLADMQKQQPTMQRPQPYEQPQPAYQPYPPLYGQAGYPPYPQPYGQAGYPPYLPLQRREPGFPWILLFGVIGGVLQSVDYGFLNLYHVIAPVFSVASFIIPIIAGFITSKITSRKWTGTITGAILVMIGYIIYVIEYPTILAVLLLGTASFTALAVLLLGTAFFAALGMLLGFIGGWLATLRRAPR